jgi:hypothetical protein
LLAQDNIVMCEMYNVVDWPPYALIRYADRVFELSYQTRINYKTLELKGNCLREKKKSYQPLNYTLKLFNSDETTLTPYVNLIEFQWDTRWCNLNEEQRTEAVVPHCDILLSMERRRK